MLYAIRSLIAAALAFAPVHAAASHPCEVVSQIIDIDTLIGRGAGHQDSLRHMIATIPAGSGRLLAASAAQGDTAIAQGYERTHLSDTLNNWRRWAAASKGGATVEAFPAARLTVAQRRSMRHFLLGCDGSQTTIRGGGSLSAYGSQAGEGASRRGRWSGSGSGRPAHMGSVQVHQAYGNTELGLAALLVLGCCGLFAIAVRLDDRQDRRYRFRGAGRIVLENGRAAAATFRDISRTGCRVELAADVSAQPGRSCSVIFGPGQVVGTVVWSDRRQIGISFGRHLSHADIADLRAGRPSKRSGSVSSPFGAAGTFPPSRKYEAAADRSPARLSGHVRTST